MITTPAPEILPRCPNPYLQQCNRHLESPRLDLQPDGAGLTDDPIWSIGTVMPNATNTWSDGYQVGLWVEVPVCAGTSPFWETADPSEETQWSCEQILVYGFYSVLERSWDGHRSMSGETKK